jgi:hypothetical protein
MASGKHRNHPNAYRHRKVPTQKPEELYLLTCSYEWPFNRRFDLNKSVERLARIAGQTAPAPQPIDRGRLFAGDIELIGDATFWSRS